MNPQTLSIIILAVAALFSVDAGCYFWLCAVHLDPSRFVPTPAAPRSRIASSGL